MTARITLSVSKGFNRCIAGRDGFLVYNANDIYGGGGIERYGEESEIEARLLRQLCGPGSVVVEAGAHMGMRTVPLARHVGPDGFVYAYEPQRLIFQVLCANLALNSVPNVDARPAAVGAERGWVELPDLDYSKRNNFGGVAVRACTGGKRVPLVRLDEDLELIRLNLMKIDVEGMELDVLRGADGLIRRFRPALYVENDRLDKSAELIRHLMDLDYRLYWHTPAAFNPANYYGETDNIFPNLVSVNMVGLPRAAEQQVRGLAEVLDSGEHPMRRRSG
jgi:FkbM family methyltransferase